MCAGLSGFDGEGGVEEKHALPLAAKPVSGTKAEGAAVVRGEQRLDLSRFALGKGDKVEVAVSAEDARGNRPGRVASSEPIAFEVTDREGLLAGLLEADEEGAERLDAIIRRELGIGSER